MIKIEVFTQHLQRVQKAQDTLRPLYILCTDEPLLLMEAQDHLRLVAKEKGYSERQVLMHDPQFDWGVLFSGNQNMSLFGEKRLIELSIPTGKPGRDGSDALKLFAKQVEEHHGPELDNITCILLPRVDSQTQKSAWFSALDDAGMAIRIDNLDRHVLPEWIKNRLQLQGQELEAGQAGAKAAQFMVDQIEGNLIAAHQEIQKLGLLYPKGVITHSQIRESILHVARYDAFLLTEAYLAGDMPRINRMLDGLRGEGEALVLIVWSLSEEIRLLRNLKIATSHGEDIQSLMRTRRIWGKREQLIPHALHRMGLPLIERALHMIADIDKQSKGIAVEQMPTDPWDGLRRIGGLFSFK